MRDGIPFRALTTALLLLGACSGVPAPSEWRLAKLRSGEMLSIRVGDRKVCVLDRGRGPAVLLLHGLGGSAYDWRALADDLAAAGRRVLIPDLLGSGYTDAPADGDYTPRGQAELAARLLDDLGVTRADVVGNSYGGCAAIFLALDFPDRVNRLVLLDPAVALQEFPFYIALARIPVIGELVVAISPASWIVSFVVDSAYHDPTKMTEEELEEYAHERRRPGNGTAAILMARSLEYRGAATLHERLGEIRAPTLLFWGEDDRITLSENAPQIAAAIPGARLVTVPLAGHVPHMERPDAVRPLLLDFLR